MKKSIILFTGIILTSIMLVLPLYAQEIDTDKEEAGEESIALSEARERQKERKPFSFTRRYFEIGVNAGAGLDNNLLGGGEVLGKNIVLNLDKLASKDGLNIHTDLLGDFFVNVRMDHGWGFGFFAGLDGDISGNIPQSLLALVSAGNINDPVSSGNIGTSGSIFADTGVNAFAKFGGLRIGISASVYTPIVYISRNSAMTYFLDTTEGVKLWTEGAIDVYTPFSLQEGSSVSAEDITGAYGLDLSLEAEYSFSPFFDLGASISHIPLSAAELQNRTQLRLKADSDDGYIINSEDLLNERVTISDLEFERTYDTDEPVKVMRPIRFDVYGIYRPFARNPNVLAVRGNVGLTADITGEETYFNFGLEARTSLARNLFSAWLSTGLVEDIWRHRLGIAVNLRAFELAMEGVLRSEDFIGSFGGQGYGVKVGLRFGW